MAHRSARLSVYARQLLVDRVEVLGKPVAMVATELGVSRATGYKWVRRHRAEDRAGLEALPTWLDFYNHHRPRSAIGGLVPHAALVNNLRGNHI